MNPGKCSRDFGKSEHLEKNTSVEQAVGALLSLVAHPEHLIPRPATARYAVNLDIDTHPAEV